MQWGAQVKNQCMKAYVYKCSITNQENLQGKNGKGAFYPAGFKIFEMNDFLNLKMELKRE